MKKYRYLIIPIISIVIFTVLFNSNLNRKYEEIKQNKDLTQIKHTPDQKIRDKGVLLKDEMRNEGDLILLGSSELATGDEQNPVNIFPFKGAEYDVSIYGTAHTQTLHHTAMLNSINNLNEDDKIAIIVSAQWFQYEEGINYEGFSANFSEQQFYKIFRNDKVSKESKVQYAKRIAEILEQGEYFVEELVYSKLYASNNILSKIALGLLQPYYRTKEYMLDTKDKVQSVKVYETLNNKKNTNIEKINWEEEYLKAENEATGKVTNNDFNVEDKYYDTYIRPRYEELNGYWDDVDLLNSKEMKDYELFLNVSNELGVKPYIILMPVNGFYYDYIGLDKEERTLFYNATEKMAKEKGFEVLNLQSKEYEKYYLIDVMHLGWKGWINVNEEMYKYFD